MNALFRIQYANNNRRDLAKLSWDLDCVLQVYVIIFTRIQASKRQLFLIRMIH